MVRIPYCPPPPPPNPPPPTSRKEGVPPTCSRVHAAPHRRDQRMLTHGMGSHEPADAVPLLPPLPPAPRPC